LTQPTNVRDRKEIRERLKQKITAIPRGAVFTYASLVLLGVCTGLFSMLLGASVYGVPRFLSYFNSAATVLLNVLPPVAVILLLYYATGRAWIAFTVPSAIILVASGVDFFKIQIRGDPFFPGDIAIVGEAVDIMGKYSFSMNWKIYVTAAFLILGVLYSAFVVRKKPTRAVTRIVGCAVVIAVSAALYFGAYSSDALYSSVGGDEADGKKSASAEYITRGFIYPFLHSVKNEFPKKPDGYSPQDAETLLSQYSDDDIPVDKRINVISVMLESCFDLSEYTDGVNPDVYDKWHDLQQESVHGHLVDNIFAGGTIDTERLFLTGYLTLDNYTKRVDSYLYYLREQGYYTEGFHSGDGWYYGREDVHKYLGFNEYYYLESFDDATRMDDYFFPKLLELYDARDKSVPYFNHSLTYQNHGAYFDYFTGETSYYRVGELTDPAYNILNNYLTGVQDTVERIYDFVGEFRDDPEPVVLMFYGDHKPWLGNDSYVYAELGIDLDSGDDASFYNTYTSPYLIWANDSAKAVSGSDFTGDGGDFSPCFFMNKLFALCSWGGDRFMKASNDLLAVTDVVNTPTGFFRENGVLTDTLSPDAKRVYDSFRIIEEYRRYK
jgi:hypothetical protein